jgi:hypothetical protein
MSAPPQLDLLRERIRRRHHHPRQQQDGPLGEQRALSPVVGRPVPVDRAGYAALAEKERRLISQRTRDGLAAARRRGKKLGGHNAQSDKTAAEATAFAEQMRPILAELAALSANRAAAVLNERKVASGGRSMVLDAGHQAAAAARQAMIPTASSALGCVLG